MQKNTWLSKLLHSTTTTITTTAGVICCLVLLVSGCATAILPGPDGTAARLGFQNKALSPGNGGQLISEQSLKPGDIILTADNGINSMGIRLATLSPVSHAALYIGDGQIAEAVGSGIRLRSVDAVVADEATVVAFRHPKITPAQALAIRAFSELHIGEKYNFFGIMLQAPFTLERRLCELPLVPSAIRDFCIRGVAAVQLGLGRNDQFFCSQFVLEAYRSADLPLTDADPRLINPGDLLNMREGDVPSIKIHQALQYVGHLKAPPFEVASHEPAQP